MVLEIAKRTIRLERDALNYTLGKINKNFEKACTLILKAKGRVVLVGLGKPGFIAQKISATLSSTGTASFYLHPAEALHGDLGRIVKDDVVVALSNSGKTEEIVKLLPLVRKIGAKIVAFTGNLASPLAKHSDVVIDVSVKKEACPMNLAPTTSTTVMLAMGDALAIALLEQKGFKEKDFAFYHPAGSLGKKLLLISDIMRQGTSNPVVDEKTSLREVLYAITKARAGSATVVNKKKELVGIFTDGDLRRSAGEGYLSLTKPVSIFMTKNPIAISADKLAAEALEILRSKKIDELPVIDKKRRPVGLLDVQDLLKAGIV